MVHLDVLRERLFDALINGDRAAARAVVADAGKQHGAHDMLMQLYWPVHETIENLARRDQLTLLSYQMGTRLLRMLVDQAAQQLTLAPRNGKTIFATCGSSQGEELAAQMACDMLEASGFTVSFAGGGVPADEVMAQVQERRPTYLVMFASAASDLPGIRHIIDSLREIDAVPQTHIAVGGGVFARHEGLADEIGCELSATSPQEIVELLLDPPMDVPQILPDHQPAARKRSAPAARPSTRAAFRREAA